MVQEWETLKKCIDFGQNYNQFSVMRRPKMLNVAHLFTQYFLTDFNQENPSE